MALDINGFNSAFRNFVEFARRRDAKAVTGRLVIDLSAGNPPVTDCKISQPLA